MDHQLLPVTTTSDKQKKQLEKSIQKKRKAFLELSEKVTVLQKELDSIEEEYKARIGTLYQEDTLLDVAIIRRKRINQLRQEGKALNEAEEIVRQSMEQETEKVEKERIKIFEHLFDEEGNTLPNTTDIRLLWKKLVRQFHPDLTNDTTEKKEREKIIKSINSAYKENNIQALQEIEERGMIKNSNNTKNATPKELEHILVDIENALIRLRQVFKELKQTEWYAFWKLKKQERKALFSEMEKKLKEDIASKQRILTALMKQA